MSFVKQISEEGAQIDGGPVAWAIDSGDEHLYYGVVVVPASNRTRIVKREAGNGFTIDADGTLTTREYVGELAGLGALYRWCRIKWEPIAVDPDCVFCGSGRCVICRSRIADPHHPECPHFTTKGDV